MQITLNQDEIVDAIVLYTKRQINIADDQDIAVDLKAGRGENGFTATLDIRPTELSSKVSVVIEVTQKDLDKAESAPEPEPVAAPKKVQITGSANHEKPAAAPAAKGLFAKAKPPVTKAEPEAEAEETTVTDEETLVEETLGTAAEEDDEVIEAETTPAPKKIFNFGKS